MRNDSEVWLSSPPSDDRRWRPAETSSVHMLMYARAAAPVEPEGARASGSGKGGDATNETSTARLSETDAGRVRRVEGEGRGVLASVGDGDSPMRSGLAAAGPGAASGIAPEMAGVGVENNETGSSRRSGRKDEVAPPIP